MNTPSRLLRGSKASGRHSTVIPCAVAFIKRIKAMSCVSRFIPGKVAHVGNGKRRAHTAPILAAFASSFAAHVIGKSLRCSRRTLTRWPMSFERLSARSGNERNRNHLDHLTRVAVR